MRRRKTFQAHREGTTRGRTSDTGKTNEEGTGDDACKHSGSEKAASSGQGVDVSRGRGVASEHRPLLGSDGGSATSPREGGRG